MSPDLVILSEAKDPCTALLWKSGPSGPRKSAMRGPRGRHSAAPRKPGRISPEPKPFTCEWMQRNTPTITLTNDQRLATDH